MQLIILVSSVQWSHTLFDLSSEPKDFSGIMKEISYRTSSNSLPQELQYTAVT